MPPSSPLGVSDIYMLLDGGVSGNERVLMMPFQRADKCTNRFHIFKDQDSVDARHERVRGIGNIQQTEYLTMVTATPLALPPKKYTTYHGGTAGNVIGPCGPAERKRAMDRHMEREEAHLRHRTLHRRRR